MVEFILTRQFPRGPVWKATLLSPFVWGVHSEYFYKAVEAGADGIIDFRLDESGNPSRNMIRIRSFRNVHFDGTWHSLVTRENFEVDFEK